jgi:hypothetical protein
MKRSMKPLHFRFSNESRGPPVNKFPLYHDFFADRYFSGLSLPEDSYNQTFQRNLSHFEPNDVCNGFLVIKR